MSGPAAKENPCWAAIGTLGDGSCERLAAHVHCRNCDVFAAAGRALLDREPPPEWLAQWTAALASPKEEAAPAALAVTVFRLGEEWLALETSAVVKVSPARMEHRIPHRRSAVLLGLVSVDGELVLCASLDGLLGLSAPAAGAAPRAQLLLAAFRGERWALPVDEVAGVHRVDERGLEPLPATLAHDQANHSRGIVRISGRPTALLDTERLFASLAAAVPS